MAMWKEKKKAKLKSTERLLCVLTNQGTAATCHYLGGKTHKIVWPKRGEEISVQDQRMTAELVGKCSPGLFF